MPVILFLLFLFSATAQEPLQSYHIGNSLTWDLHPSGIAEIAKQRQISQRVGYHIECGKPLPYIWANPDSTCVKPVAEFGTFRPALSQHSWDAVTIQPFRGSTLAEDVKVITDIIGLVQKQGTRFVIHCAWPGNNGKGYAAAWLREVPDADDTPTTHCRSYFSHLMRRLQAVNDVDLAMLPAGELLFRLDSALRAQHLGELRSVESLYRDAVHLKTDVGRFAVAATAFAVIHGQSPRGLRKPGAFGKSAAFPEGYVELVADTIAAVLAPTRANAAKLRRAKNPDAGWQDVVDTGPFISDTFRGPGKDADVIALKGVAIKLGAEEQASVLFDTEALRMVAAFGGQVTLAGTPWDGRHSGNSYTPGDRQAYSLLAPKSGRADGQFLGLNRHGNEIVIRYRLGQTEIQELPELINGSISRSFTIGPALAEITIPLEGRPQLLGEADPKSEVGARVLIDRVGGDLNELAMGPPRTNDSGAGLEIREVRKNEGFAGFTDGIVHPSQKVVFDGQASARTTLDLGRLMPLARINSYSSYAHRARQRFTIWASQSEEQPPLAVGSPKLQGWTRIALVDTGALQTGGNHASSVHAGPDGLGAWRHLAFVFDKVNGRGHGTLFDEIDILSLDDDLPHFHDRNARQIETHVSELPAGVDLQDGVLRVPAGTEAFRCRISYVDAGREAPATPPRDLAPLLQGGPAIFPEVQYTQGQRGADTLPYAVDTIPLPADNPWGTRTRFGGFDFFADGKRAACSTWNGDVWIVEGIDALETLRWRRFASGLFQTLGLRIVDDVIYVQGRDQITRLHDSNEDGEADFYECFNNEVQITSGFHEFSFDLQTDAAGNFYFSKGMPVLGGGRGFAPWTPHNGAVLKVSPDGKLERVAWGLRAPGGIGIGPNGEITTGENEGSWVPRCKITWSKPGSFHGVVPSEWDGRSFVRILPDAPTDYEKPLCWLPYHVDNSSGSQVWTPDGEMLHLSYGKAHIFRVLRDEVEGQVQGGVTRLPVDLAVAPMRARFHPQTGDLYVIGLRGWQTSGADGFQRLRYIAPGAPSPISLQAHNNGLVIGFSGALSAESAGDAQRFAVSKWKYVWGPQYGSGRFSIDAPDVEAEVEALKSPSKGSHNKMDRVRVRAAAGLSGNRVFLYIPDMTTAMQMEIRMDLEATDGDAFRSNIYNTVHALRPAFEDHGLDLANLPEPTRRVQGEPGLIMNLAFRSTDDATRVDRLALNVSAGEPITPFFQPKAFEATFSGDLVVPARDDLAFRLIGSGTATLSLAGTVLLEGELPLESQPMAMNTGPHSLFASFRGDKKGVGRVQMQWSGKDFVWEPVPPSAFRYLPNARLARKDRIREGRAIFAAARCIRCHAADFATGMPELSERDADFVNIGARLRPEWLANWVRTPQGDCPPVASADADDVLAWFLKDVKPVLREAVQPSGDGQKLIEALHLAPWLEEIRGKYTHVGLREFLANPTAHHPDTLFPTLALSPGEVEAIALSLDQPAVGLAVKGDAERGENIVAQRCDMCHGKAKPTATGLAKTWKRGWAQLATHDPPLGLSEDQVSALRAFQNADSDSGLRSLRYVTPREYAERTIDRLRCAQCHASATGLPDITTAGSKLQGSWLTELLRGAHAPTRPWLAARMPAFSSRADTLARGICDREGILFADSASANSASANSATGAELSGLQGYACNACHAVGDQPAIQAFEGQGPNLGLAKARLRWDYFQRWMHHPQRIQPSTIMPRYSLNKTRAAKADVLAGDAAAQFAAIWAWLQGI